MTAHALPLLLALATADYGGEFDVSAYCPCAACTAPFNDGVTATGRDATLPGIAVDRNVIPLGSLVILEGAGVYLADDVGGAIRGDKLDIRFQTHAEALEWGRKRCKVWVLLRKEGD